MSHVLVVDDEASMRAALDANFRRSGWQVTTASGVAEALAKFRQCAVRACGHGHAHGGWRRLGRYAGRAPGGAGETAVIFLTAYGNVPEAVLAMKEGACDYLMKPVSFDATGRNRAANSGPRRLTRPASNAAGIRRRIVRFSSPGGQSAARGADASGYFDRSGKRNRKRAAGATDSSGQSRARQNLSWP